VLNSILITGGAGFIGSHLLDRSLTDIDGHQIVVVDNFNDYYDPDLKRQNIANSLKNPHCALYEGDIRDFDFLDKLFERYHFGQVVHLAAMAGVRASLENPAVYVEVDIKGTVNLLELARRYSVKNFVSASSSSVYGLNTKVPFAETDPVDAQISPYAVAKRAGELYCETYARLYQFPIASLRFFTVYGPRQRPEMAIRKFTTLIEQGEPIPFFGDGSSRRDYTYIDDIVDGIMAAMKIHQPGHFIYNLGNSNTVSLAEMVAIIEKYLGKKAILQKLPDQAGDVPITFADLAKSKADLNYAPKVSLEEGIQRFVVWYKEKNEGLEKSGEKIE
jgi:UDP-glucuronate 4-epimerase